MRRALFVFVPLFALLTACSSSSSSDGTTSDTGTSADTGPATCSAPGKLTDGTKDAHCGTRTQVTSAASCHPTDVDAGSSDTGSGDASDAADAGDSGMGGMDMGLPEECPYGDTVFGGEADDDDCKYHVKWTLGDICEGSGGVPITVTVTTTSDGKPAVGAATDLEVFTTTTTGTCDNASTHPGPNTGTVLSEGSGGTYTGKVVFDKPGAWTVRLHFHEDCADTVEDSPHGHVAFHVTVP